MATTTQAVMAGTKLKPGTVFLHLQQFCVLTQMAAVPSKIVLL
jgi:hypothetical protein